MWPWQRRKRLELRDFQDLTGFSVGQGLSSPLSAHAALRRISGWIAIASRPVVDRIAGLKWQATNDAGEEIEKSPFVDLLNRPNPTMSGCLALRMIAQTLVLSGEAYLIIRRGRRTGRAAELWPTSPDRVARVWEDGRLWYDVSPGNSQGEPERHRPEDVIRVYRPRPDDLFEGYGAAAMVWDEVLAEQGWSQSVRHWFERDARPSMTLEFDKDTPMPVPEEAELFFKMWSQAQQRRDGTRFGVPVLTPSGGTLRELSGLGSSENLQPTEEALKRKILAALGTPHFLIGNAAEANRASAEASLWAFDFSAVRPWTELIVDALNHSLGDEFAGQTVRFADWVWRDRLAESEIDMRLLQQKVLSPNEARQKRNLPPAEWGQLPVGQQQDEPYRGDTNAPSSNDPQRGRRGLRRPRLVPSHE